RRAPGRAFMLARMGVEEEKTGWTDEDQELAQGAQGPSPRQPHGSPQGPHLHHQQDRAALQGPPGLRPRRLSREFQLDVSHCADRFPRMRSVLVVSILILASLAAPAQAQQTGRNSTAIASEDPAARLDALFAELKRA